MRPTTNGSPRNHAGRARPALTVIVVGIAIASLAWAAPAAAASDRHASPDGSGTACTKAKPCDLGTAISLAPKGARVLVPGNQGDYVRSAAITANKEITLQGTDGQPRIVFTDGGLRLAKGGKATNLRVEAYGDEVAFALDGGADASRVFATNGGTGHACTLMGGSNLTNVVCWADGLADKAIEIKGDATLRNVTAYGGTEAGLRIVGYDICACDRFTVTLINTIVWAPTSTDLSVTTDLPDVTIKPTTSNYRTVDFVEEGADIRIIKSDTNQTKAGKRPKFMDQNRGNFRSVKGSPVIDSGATARADGPKDLDGRGRTAGARTDIGAYEFTPPNTTITGGPKGTVAGAPAPFRFSSSRPGSTFECRADSTPTWNLCTSPWAIGWTLGAHTFRVRAVDKLGYIDPTPATRSFKVAAP